MNLPRHSTVFQLRPPVGALLDAAAAAGPDDAAVDRVDRKRAHPALRASPALRPLRLAALDHRWRRQQPAVPTVPATTPVHRLVDGDAGARIQRPRTPRVGGERVDARRDRAGPHRAPVLAGVARLVHAPPTTDPHCPRNVALAAHGRDVDRVRCARVERDRRREDDACRERSERQRRRRARGRALPLRGAGCGGCSRPARAVPADADERGNPNRDDEQHDRAIAPAPPPCPPARLLDQRLNQRFQLAAIDRLGRTRWAGVRWTGWRGDCHGGAQLVLAWRATTPPSALPA